MTKKNGWRRVAFAAATVVTVAAAMAVLRPYVVLPWAPKALVVITFVWASENSLARLDNQLFSYEELLEQAILRKDRGAIRRQTKNITDTQRKIEKVEVAIEKEKK